MTEIVIKVGHVYSAKRPRASGFPELLNDRQVLWMDSLGEYLQYDNPTVGHGRKYPKISVKDFIEWAKDDVTELMPKGEWRTK